MKKLFVVISACSLVVMMAAFTNVYALDLGNNITIYDNWDKADPNNPGNTWYTSHNEDQELEYNSSTGDAWDLEAFFLKGSMLNMMGTYNFKNTDYYEAGDIFIDVDGNDPLKGAKYGADALTSTDPLYGYDYVLDMDFVAQTFSIVKLTAGSTLLAPTHVQVGTPWRYNSGGEVLGTGYTFGYNVGGVLTDAASGFKSDGINKHNVVSLDLSPLFNLGLFKDVEFVTLHTTMECGNDNLMGKFDPSVPEPGTVLLLGSGLLGIAALLRKRGNK